MHVADWRSTGVVRLYKGGSRVLGTKNIEVTVHVMVPSTGQRPVDATPWASPGVGLEGGVPPP